MPRAEDTLARWWGQRRSLLLAEGRTLWPVPRLPADSRVTGKLACARSDPSRSLNFRNLNAAQVVIPRASPPIAGPVRRIRNLLRNETSR